MTNRVVYLDPAYLTPFDIKETIIFEYDGTNTLVARYTHGSGIDNPISMDRGGQSYFYHADRLGSIRLLLTDISGNIVQTYQYDSFGNIVNISGSVVNPYTFTGREYDAESGLYYYRARYYDPGNGRFISEDPSGFMGDDANLYRYVWNNPVNFTDPLGLDPTDDDYRVGDLCVEIMQQRINTGSCPGWEECFVCCAELLLIDWMIYICQEVCEEGLKAYKKATGKCCDQ